MPPLNVQDGASTMTSSPEVRHPRLEKVQYVLAVMMLLLFAYSVLVWRGVIGDGSEYRPLAGVLLTGAMLMQSTGALLGRKWRWLQFLLIGLSLVMLFFSLRTRS
jgi:hypothetical protein